MICIANKLNSIIEKEIYCEKQRREKKGFIRIDKGT